MPRTPRYLAQARIVDAFMALLPDYELASLSITQVCHRAGVNRSSFYQHFEDVEDLDQQFLVLYFRRMVSTSAFRPQTMDELIAHYVRLVGAMVAAPEFFRAVKALPRLACYSDRWKVLVEEGLRAYFRRPGLLDDGPLWNLHLEFALAVVHRYCDLGFQGTSGFDVPTLGRWMVEFQIGGLLRLAQESERGLAPSNPALDAQLSSRTKGE